MYATCQRPVGSLLFNQFIYKWCRDWYILFRPLSKFLESPFVGDSEIRVRNLPSKFWVEISPALKQSLIVSVYWDVASWVVIFKLYQYESSDRPNSVGWGIVKLHSLARTPTQGVIARRLMKMAGWSYSSWAKRGWVVCGRRPVQLLFGNTIYWRQYIQRTPLHTRIGLHTQCAFLMFTPVHFSNLGPTPSPFQHTWTGRV